MGISRGKFGGQTSVKSTHEIFHLRCAAKNIINSFPNASIVNPSLEGQNHFWRTSFILASLKSVYGVLEGTSLIDFLIQKQNFGGSTAHPVPLVPTLMGGCTF